MILYYNVHYISDILREEPELFFNTPFLCDNYDGNLFRTYDKFGLNSHNAVYDRSGKLPHYLNITKDLHPLPKQELNYSKSFFEVSEIRAKELLALNKPINVLWSGGIDSTYVLFILKHFANDPEQIRIWGTYNSIIESGDMFDRRLKHEFKHTIRVASRNDLNYPVNDDCIFVSGMCGNQLFGPTDDMFATGDTAMFHHTLGTPDTIYSPYETNIDENLLEFLDPIIKSSPRKIETIADLRWLCIFNLDWYTAVYEHKILLNKPTADRIYGFFDSTEVQSWAVNTKESFTKTPGNPNTHRWQMRQILSELFGETHYSLNKTKKISSYAFFESSWMLLLEDYRNVFI